MSKIIKLRGWRNKYAIFHETAQELSSFAAELVVKKMYRQAASLFKAAARYEKDAVDDCPDKLERTKTILKSSLDALLFKAKKYKALADRATKRKKKR